MNLKNSWQSLHQNQPLCISNFTDLEETITKLSSFPIDEINRIGKTADALSQKDNATQLLFNAILGPDRN